MTAACELYAREVNAIHTLNTPAWRLAGCNASLGVHVDPSAKGVNRLENGRARRQAYCTRTEGHLTNPKPYPRPLKAHRAGCERFHVGHAGGVRRVQLR